MSALSHSAVGFLLTTVLADELVATRLLRVHWRHVHPLSRCQMLSHLMRFLSRPKTKSLVLVMPDSPRHQFPHALSPQHHPNHPLTGYQSQSLTNAPWACSPVQHLEKYPRVATYLDLQNSSLYSISKPKQRYDSLPLLGVVLNQIRRVTGYLLSTRSKSR